MSNKQRVLLLCTDNSARSQMAEAFLRKYGSDKFEAHSAGLKPRGLRPIIRPGDDEIGLDVSGQHSKGVDMYLGKTLFQYLITVCDDADKNCPTTWHGISNRIHGHLKTQLRSKEQRKRNLISPARYGIRLK